MTISVFQETNKFSLNLIAKTKFSILLNNINGYRTMTGNGQILGLIPYRDVVSELGSFKNQIKKKLFKSGISENLEKIFLIKTLVRSFNWVASFKN